MARSYPWVCMFRAMLSARAQISYLAQSYVNFIVFDDLLMFLQSAGLLGQLDGSTRQFAIQCILKGSAVVGVVVQSDRVMTHFVQI